VPASLLLVQSLHLLQLVPRQSTTPATLATVATFAVVGLIDAVAFH
jgi:hypothetical protein